MANDRLLDVMAEPVEKRRVRMTSQFAIEVQPLFVLGGERAAFPRLLLSSSGVTKPYYSVPVHALVHQRIVWLNLSIAGSALA